MRHHYLQLLQACILRGDISRAGDEIDHRYFYMDSQGRGRYSCGLARQAIMGFLREYGEEYVFLGPEWSMSLDAFKNNPSVIGFTVEQMIISRIASAGVTTGAFKIPGAKIIPFEDNTALLQTEQKVAYYIPVKFNLKAIDGLFVSLNTKHRTAVIVAIQITVAKRHKDSVQAFFASWDQWMHRLENFTIKASFLWIHEGERGQREVEAKLRELRGTTEQNWPDHTVYWVSIEQIDKDLARRLGSIRPSYWSTPDHPWQHTGDVRKASEGILIDKE
jgi:hypothetical protein